MYKHLTQNELYYIWQHCINKFSGTVLLCESVESLAIRFKKHKSTIYRGIKYLKTINWQPEINKNCKIRTRKKLKFRMFNKKIKIYVEEKLKIGWSPEIISGRIKKDINCKVSFKTIYNYIWQDKNNYGVLYKSLPHRGKRYKYGSTKKSNISNRVDISERPKIVDKKSRIGDLEGDTIVGKKGGDKACLLTLVDRNSKFTMMRKIPNKTAVAVENAMYDCYDNTVLPFKTITYDNGTEFTNHENIANTLDCNIYFAIPYKSCDRGLNEHTNGKIRWFFPKKTDFSTITDDEVLYVQNLLNDRPRKSLNYLTPNEVVNKYLTKAYKNFSHLT